MTRVVAEGLDPFDTRVRDVKTQKVAPLDPESSFREALAVIDRLHIRHLPVLAGRQLLGTVSMRDLQELEANVREVELRFLDDYFDRMDDAAWGPVPVAHISERVVIRCKEPHAPQSESEVAAVWR